MTKRILILTALLIAFFSVAYADALTGQQISTFETYYAQNITFINENDNHLLLPQIISKRKSDKRDGKYFYEITGDVLSLTIRTDTSGQTIEYCEITLTAPEGMEPGSAVYNDFTNAGYHSYAMLMAMHTSPDVLTRYGLVDAVVKGMAAGEGFFESQMGVYNLRCVRQEGVATLLFENKGLAPTVDPNAPPKSEVSESTGDGEAAGESTDDTGSSSGVTITISD